jgi:hypothetical protein
MLPYKPDDEMQYMINHAPTCIVNIKTDAINEARNSIQSDFGDNTTVFGIKCNCGNDKVRIIISESNGHVHISCPKCSNTTEIFNPSVHGYEGALGLREKDANEDEAESYICQNCNSTEFVIATGYQYAGETDVLEDDDLDVKPEDLFGTYIVCVKCVKCGEIEIIYNFECA